jgi:hypothetical protein
MKNIGDLVEKITALNGTFYVLVINDNAPDGTANIIMS